MADEEKRGVDKSVLKCTFTLRYDKVNKKQNVGLDDLIIT